MIDRDTLNGLAECQAAVLSRAQLLRYGVTEDAIAWKVASKRWRTLHPGVFLTSPGRRDWDVTAWGALLVCGPDAVLSHESAAFSHGLLARAPEVVDVLIPHGREAAPRPGVRVHRCRDHARRVDPDELVVPRTRLRDTVLDVASRLGSATDVLALVTDACRRGLTYEDELRTALAARRTHPWSSVLREALAESDAGAESVLEAQWVRRVLRPHGLPEGVAQLEQRGGRRRHDRAYPDLRVLVELQGLAFHGSASAVVRDGRRARASAADGWVTLPFFWADVHVSPCATAVELAALLRRHGWGGRARRCRARGCTAPVTGSRAGSPAP